MVPIGGPVSAKCADCRMPGLGEEVSDLKVGHARHEERFKGVDDKFTSLGDHVVSIAKGVSGLRTMFLWGLVSIIGTVLVTVIGHGVITMLVNGGGH